jgi:hypothetical protein
MVDMRLRRQLLEAAVLSGGEVTLEDLVRQFANRDRYQELIPALRSLEEQGSGRFIVGRKGHATRFVCADGVMSRRRGDSERQPPPPPAVSARRTGSEQELKTYEIGLQGGGLAELKLPIHLTKTDAERLSRIILAMAVDE